MGTAVLDVSSRKDSCAEICSRLILKFVYYIIPVVHKKYLFGFLNIIPARQFRVLGIDGYTFDLLRNSNFKG